MLTVQNSFFLFIHRLTTPGKKIFWEMGLSSSLWSLPGCIVLHMFIRLERIQSNVFCFHLPHTLSIPVIPVWDFRQTSISNLLLCGQQDGSRFGKTASGDAQYPTVPYVPGVSVLSGCNIKCGRMQWICWQKFFGPINHTCHIYCMYERLPKSTRGALFLSIKEFELPCCAPKQKMLCYLKHPKCCSKSKHDLLLMTNFQRQVTPINSAVMSRVWITNWWLEFANMMDEAKF